MTKRGTLLISDEARTVIEEGMERNDSYYEIARILTNRGIPTAKGKTVWNNSTVGRICKRLNSADETYEDPAKVDPEPRVPLACGCGAFMTRIRDLFHHTWDEHHRVPTRQERTPCTRSQRVDALEPSC